MWLTITILTAAGAAVGACAFLPGSDHDPSTQVVVSAVEGLAAGAMLTMIAQTMMPVAKLKHAAKLFRRKFEA